MDCGTNIQRLSKNKMSSLDVLSNLGVAKMWLHFGVSSAVTEFR